MIEYEPLLRWRSNLADHMVKDLMPVRERIGMRRSDIMLVNIAVWVNSEKNLRANISMWADYYKRHKQQMPFVIWRDASVQHFNTPTGVIFACILAKVVVRRVRACYSALQICAIGSLAALVCVLVTHQYARIQAYDYCILS